MVHGTAMLRGVLKAVWGEERCPKSSHNVRCRQAYVIQHSLRCQGPCGTHAIQEALPLCDSDKTH